MASVTKATKDLPLFCVRCGHSTTKLEVLNRRFNTGFSGCCDDNLSYVRPKNPHQPRELGYVSYGKNVVHPNLKDLKKHGN